MTSQLSLFQNVQGLIVPNESFKDSTPTPRTNESRHETGNAKCVENNFSGSTSLARANVDKRRMAATVEEGTAPKSRLGKSGGSTSPTNSAIRRDVTAGETAHPLRGMVHTIDPETSRSAATFIREHCAKTQLHGKVLDAIKSSDDGLTDSELENLRWFRGYGPSTIRKRRSELFQAGLIRDSGRTRTNERGRAMTVWEVTKR